MKNATLAATRISMGFIFLWAFLDKTFGLGFATAPENSWLNGNSPTGGFLSKAVKGPFAGVFHSMAGSVFVDWLFMLGLLLIGLALILGIGMKIATSAGSFLLFLMWLSLLFPNNNPILDDHVIYILVLCLLKHENAGNGFGFGKWWGGTGLVKKYGFLK